MRRDWRVVHQVAAWCLGYPDEELIAKLPLLRSALDEQPSSEPVRLLRGFVDTLAKQDPHALQHVYVELFDLRRHQTLHLSYWRDGDTRRRGESLARFKARLREGSAKGDWLVDTGGELPDHLPMVLEYAALADPAGGRELMIENRSALELIRLSLTERGSAYADVLAAVCATLPGPSAKDRREALAMARAEPPQESVGIDLPFPTSPGTSPRTSPATMMGAR